MGITGIIVALLIFGATFGMIFSPLSLSTNRIVEQVGNWSFRVGVSCFLILMAGLILIIGHMSWNGAF